MENASNEDRAFDPGDSGFRSPLRAGFRHGGMLRFIIQTSLLMELTPCSKAAVPGMPASVEPDYFKLLKNFDAQALNRHAGTIYGLWPDLTLAYMNRSWSRFATANGGSPRVLLEWTLGRSILSGMSPPLRQFFQVNYERCLTEGRPWEHVYECSSPEMYREYHMLSFPLGRGEGLLVIHSLMVESPHTRSPELPNDRQFRDAAGLVHQCCHCRRVQRNDDEHQWDWVPLWVKKPPANTSHTLCSACLGFYYCPSRAKSTTFPKTFSTIPPHRLPFPDSPQNA